MNYFGHAAIATLRGENAAFVLGSMLPDLCAMTGVTEVPFSNEEVQQGAQFHIRTDSVFHQSESFIQLNALALFELGQRGVRRGPARASAHIGVEMLIDAELAGRKELLLGYLEALHWGSQSADHFLPLSEGPRALLYGLCGHLFERGAHIHTSSQSRFYERLGHTLRGRKRLEPTEEELRIIAQYLSTEDRVGQRVPGLMAELLPLYSNFQRGVV